MENNNSPIQIPVISVEEENKRLTKKLDERFKYKVLTDADHKNSEKNRLLAVSLARESFSFFCNNFLWIQDPEAEDPLKKEIPFILWDFQEHSATHIINHINTGQDIPIEKSRKMGLSWLLIAILVWGWHFQKWECLVGSQKEENVDKRGNIKSLIEKARYLLYRTPDWMIPPLQKNHDKKLLLINPVHQATIAGESNNTNFGRSDRRKVILFDEFSSWEQTDRAAWQSCSSTTKCRIPLSTPNTRGTNCYFYQIIQDFKQKRKPYLRLHWELNPVYANDKYINEDTGRIHSPWYDNEIRRCTSLQEVSQELDIDYEASAAGKVFSEFKYEQISEEAVYNPQLPLYVAWDFGLDQTAMLWIQVDAATNPNKIIIIDEYANDGKGGGDNIYHYLDVIDSKAYKQAIHFGDPHSGENRSLTSGQSNASILRRHGIIFKSERTRIINRVNSARNVLTSVIINPNCTLTIEMFTSWQMRRPKTGNTSSQIPEHSGYSHIGEAFTYFTYNFAQRKKQINIARKRFAPTASGVTL